MNKGKHALPRDSNEVHGIAFVEVPLAVSSSFLNTRLIYLKNFNETPQLPMLLLVILV